MSQFAAYVLPGAIFVAFGLKWTLDASTYRLGKLLEEEEGCSSRGSRKGLRRNRQRCRWSKRLPMEGIIKLLITSIGIVSSVITAYPSGGAAVISDEEALHVGNIMYSTVYLFFAISGLVDVLTFYCPHAMPFGLDQFALALAFLIEGLILTLHLRQQAFMLQHVHTLLVCVIFTCACVSLTEIVMPYSLLVKFCRALTSLVHGTWYIQSGFILHNPTRIPFQWDTTKDFNDAFVWISVAFAWHVAAAFILLLFIIILSRRRRPMLLPPEPQHIETYGFAFQHSPSSPVSPTTVTTPSDPPPGGIHPCGFCSNPTLSACTAPV